MKRSKTRAAAENFSPNIVVSKKMLEKHWSIESVMQLEEFNSLNSSDNEHNCSLDDNFNTLFTSSTADTKSEMYVWRIAGYIRKSLFIFGYLWNAIRTVLFWVGYSRASLTMYDNI